MRFIRRTSSTVWTEAYSEVLAKDVIEHEIVLPETWLPGTLKFQVQVYPTVLADLQTGMESMIREPYG